MVLERRHVRTGWHDGNGRLTLDKLTSLLRQAKGLPPQTPLPLTPEVEEVKDPTEILFLAMPGVQSATRRVNSNDAYGLYNLGTNFGEIRVTLGVDFPHSEAALNRIKERARVGEVESPEKGVTVATMPRERPSVGGAVGNFLVEKGIIIATMPKEDGEERFKAGMQRSLDTIYQYRGKFIDGALASIS